MIDFILQFGLMCIGAAIVILWRALDLIPEDDFEYRKFFMDPKNIRRFGTFAVIFFLFQVLVAFEDYGIVDAMKSVSVIGPALPALGSGGLGFAITWVRFKVKDK